MAKKTVTITIDPSKWKIFQDLSKQKLGIKASPHVEQLVDKSIAEMQGTDPNPAIKESDLSGQVKLLERKASDTRNLLKDKGTYRELNKLIGEYGVDRKNFSQPAEVTNEAIRKLLASKAAGTLKCSGADVHLFIDIIQTRVKSAELVKKLDDLRGKYYNEKATEKNGK